MKFLLLRLAESCSHQRTATYGRTGPLGEPQREKRCLDCGRTLDIREVSGDA